MGSIPGNENFISTRQDYNTSQAFDTERVQVVSGSVAAGTSASVVTSISDWIKPGNARSLSILVKPDSAGTVFIRMVMRPSGGTTPADYRFIKLGHSAATGQSHTISKSDDDGAPGGFAIQNQVCTIAKEAIPHEFALAEMSTRDGFDFEVFINY